MRDVWRAGLGGVLGPKCAHRDETGRIRTSLADPEPRGSPQGVVPNFVPTSCPYRVLLCNRGIITTRVKPA
jgi:hypothetical protein